MRGEPSLQSFLRFGKRTVNVAISGCIINILGGIKIGQVRISADYGDVIDPVIGVDQAPLGLADPTADNVLVDGISRVFAELACQVVDTEVEVVRNVLKRDILGIVLIDVGADLLRRPTRKMTTMPSRTRFSGSGTCESRPRLTALSGTSRCG